jgi:hypothetical protein
VFGPRFPRAGRKLFGVGTEQARAVFFAFFFGFSFLDKHFMVLTS